MSPQNTRKFQLGISLANILTIIALVIGSITWAHNVTSDLQTQIAIGEVERQQIFAVIEKIEKSLDRQEESQKKQLQLLNDLRVVIKSSK